MILIRLGKSDKAGFNPTASNCALCCRMGYFVQLKIPRICHSSKLCIVCAIVYACSGCQNFGMYIFYNEITIFCTYGLFFSKESEKNMLINFKRQNFSLENNLFTRIFLRKQTATILQTQIFYISCRKLYFFT